jgi:Activator of Hsp90 ATPase homolog 1-like protein
MSTPDPYDAVTKTIEVRCGVDTAFRTWTTRIDSWWPKRHSRSGDPGTTVMLEPRAGGRIYERTPDGVEHVWGTLTAWQPPAYLAYAWYLGSSAEAPSRVEVRFFAHGEERTRVEVRHRGPELIGELWTRNRPIYDTSWNTILASFARDAGEGLA